MSTEIKQKKEKRVKVDTEAEVVGEEVPKKEKKDKKRKLEEEVKPLETKENTGSGEIIGETKEERKARKRAKKEAKKADLESQVIVPTPVEGVKEETKEERKARRRAEKLAKELQDPAAPSTKIEEPVPTIPADEVALKKKSKAERKEAGANKWTTEVSEANQAMQARAEKSPIYQDESLSEMAKKGLYYCELHAASQIELQEPEYRWKFNKARQGWLMRNVWNDVEVPEAYFDKVVAYLKTLPGSARKGMIETAKKHATATVKKPTSTEGQSEAEAEVGEAEVEQGKEKEGEEKEEGEKEAGSGGEVAVEMRRDRAQRILKALGAR